MHTQESRGLRESIRHCCQRVGVVAALGLLAFLLRTDTARVPDPDRCPPPEPAPGFVTRDGSTLILDGEPFRFAGPNIYWLSLDHHGGLHYPSPFRIDNVLDTAVAMGATVVRSHALISLGCELCIMPQPGVFHDEGFQSIDYAIAAAKKRNLRLILPLMDNWDYYHGGIYTYLRWFDRNNPRDFFTDPAMRALQKTYITHILTHVNPYTGLAYTQDPTILAWETGNEMGQQRGFPITDWTIDIADHIRFLDPHHLLADGQSSNVYGLAGLNTTTLANCNLDMVSSHGYPPSATWIAQDAQLAKQYGKVYFVGEYGDTTPEIALPFASPTTLKELLPLLEQNPTVAGSLYWSLFGHADDYGRVHHDDGYEQHFPSQMTILLRRHAYAMRGETPPPFAVPVPPQGLTFSEGLAWNGVVGASYYEVEQSEDGERWNPIATQVTDDMLPLPIPEVVHPDQETWIRVRAINPQAVPGDYAVVFIPALPSP